MHTIDLSKYDLRTDLVIEKINDEIKNDHYEENGIMVDDISLESNNLLKKKAGRYITISFDDVTDQTNYLNVLSVFKKELFRILECTGIKKDASCLVIGIGNKDIISDALGNRTLKNITVTRHLYLLGDYDKKYRNVSIIEPNVIGVTGIESSDIIAGVIEKIKPDFIIAVDSLCASNIKRLNKTIQISNTGIEPGSGIGNNKKELSFETFKIPVIAIGVPTVVDSTVIVSDTINYLMQKISYLKENINNNLDKLKPIDKINYLKEQHELNDEEKQAILGYIGLLDEVEIKKLVWEVLSPINANMIVTTKEIDFIVDKLGLLISDGINSCLHSL